MNTYCVWTCVVHVHMPICSHLGFVFVCACMCPIWISQRGRHGEPTEIYFSFKPQGTFEIALTLIKPTPGSWARWVWWTFVLKSKLSLPEEFFPSSHFIVVLQQGILFQGIWSKQRIFLLGHILHRLNLIMQHTLWSIFFFISSYCKNEFNIEKCAFITSDILNSDACKVQ